MVAEVLSAAARAVREYPTEAQDAVRLRLPPDRAGSMDQGLSRSGLQARSPRVDPERECGRPAGARLSLTRSFASEFLPRVSRAREPELVAVARLFVHGWKSLTAGSAPRLAPL